jgi:hypothetical protein
MENARRAREQYFRMVERVNKTYNGHQELAARVIAPSESRGNLFKEILTICGSGCGFSASIKAPKA